MKKQEQLMIIKASGEHATFSPKKLKRSLVRSGASAEQVQSILQKIEEQLYPGINTRRIHQAAYKLLKEQSKPLAARYKLKSAIMELGPSGFPFEKYVAAILQQQGYLTHTGVLVQGKCVKHEVDVIAEKGNHHFMIECKCHNQPGNVCNVKIPLYIHSRFKDVEASWVQLPNHEVKLHQGWVITNTKFTIDAIQYGTCVGLNLLGWEYPPANGLNQQIERLRLYPLTCLTTLSNAEKQRLLDNKIVLCREICENPAVLKIAGVNEERVDSILNESNQLCYKLVSHGIRI